MSVASGRSAGGGSAGHGSAVESFVGRFSDHLRESGAGSGWTERTVVVALSGGLDSCVLLHLLRFSPAGGPRIVAAHFDHGMRRGADADRAWVGGVCRAWDVPLVTAVAEAPPKSEEEARDARYRFLRSVVATHDSAWLLTAHHADDQAETVLFRVLRGTGLEGLRGIPSSRPIGLMRPLLPFWREELEGYADAVGLSWREDPTNEHLGFARNVIRHEIMPRAEATVAPGARRALVRLASLAEENEVAWAAVMPGLLVDVGFREDGVDDISLDHASFIALDRAVRARVLRHLVGRLSRTIDRAGTHRAVEFTTSARSGTRVDLGGGIELGRELDRIVLGRRVEAHSEEPLLILDARSGSGDAVVGGRRVRVVWDTAPAGSGSDDAIFPVAELDFPLTVRGREPGDRIRLRSGTCKVKKLLLEARIPSGERSRVPILVDGSGRVLWVHGVARTSDLRWSGEGRTMKIRIGP